ncbi:MAG: hypothetical protein QF615_10520, partial [Planctomycetota bacterium]|nr:hypothetical protein [Planctomycetota bacterium]
RMPLKARARRFQASREHLLLAGEARINGVLADGSAWDISAGRLYLLPSDPELVDAPPLPFEPRLRRMEARGGYDLCLGSRLNASGATLELTGKRLLTSGTATTNVLFTGGGLHLETKRLEIDFATFLPTTPFGRIRTTPAAGAAWSVEFASLGPVCDQADGGVDEVAAAGEAETILALSEVIHRQGERAILGSWFLAWLDGPAWRARGRELFGIGGKGGKKSNDGATGIRTGAVGAGSGTSRIGGAVREASARRAAQDGPQAPLLGGLVLPPKTGLVEAIYAEGELQVLDGAVRRARAARLWLDLLSGGGWLDDADLILDVEVRDKPERLRAQARHMVHAADGSLHADNATITSCNQDRPHYVIETGDLTVTPAGKPSTRRPGEANLPSNASWAVAARDNVLRLPIGPALPLPPLVYATDEDGDPIIENIILSNSARFGTALGATVNREAGSLARGLAGLLGAPLENLDGHWRYRASWLGARGLLLGTGLRLKAPGEFSLAIDGDGVFDGHSDRGLVRVEEEERDDFRGWLRGRGR